MRLQFVALAAGEDGNRDFMQFGGGEHEIHMFGRLFQGLQQGVEGLGGQHVNFVDDDDLVAARGGQKPDFLLQLPNFLDAAVGSAVNFMRSRAVPAVISRQGSQVLQEVLSVSPWQLMALAMILARVVLPTPRTPEKRMAWATLLAR